MLYSGPAFSTDIDALQEHCQLVSLLPDLSALAVLNTLRFAISTLVHRHRHWSADRHVQCAGQLWS
jgi:hypothetical protein